jgi:hypothetical protein
LIVQMLQSCIVFFLGRVVYPLFVRLFLLGNFPI